MVENVFSGNFLSVTCENGIERVFLKGSVHTFLVTDEKNLRITVEQKLGESGTKEKIQGGCIEQGETPLASAQRELLEEMGYEAADWENFIVQESRGAVNDTRYYFIVRQLRMVENKTDGEVLQTKDYSLEELYEKAMAGQFSPLTQAAIARLHFAVLKGEVTL